MGLVQIEQSELDTLRTERNDATARATKAEQEKGEAERKVTELETEKAAAETAKTEAEAKVTTLEEDKAQAELKDTRIKSLGAGFTAKLGDFTKGRLEEQAGKLSDADWDGRLKELEEIAKVKRDDKGDGNESTSTTSTSTSSAGNGNGNEEEKNEPTGASFSEEEVASFVGGGGISPAQQAPTTPASQRQVVSSLASAFKPKAKK